MFTVRRGILLTRGLPWVSASRNSVINASRLCRRPRRASSGVDRARSSAGGMRRAPPTFANIRRTLCMCATIAAIDRPLLSGGSDHHNRDGRTSTTYSLTRQHCSNASSSSRLGSNGWATGIVQPIIRLVESRKNREFLRSENDGLVWFKREFKQRHGSGVVEARVGSFLGGCRRAPAFSIE